MRVLSMMINFPTVLFRHLELKDSGLDKRMSHDTRAGDRQRQDEATWSELSAPVARNGEQPPPFAKDFGVVFGTQAWQFSVLWTWIS